MLEGTLQKMLGNLATKTLSLGVTGLSGAGKTVFIGALTHALLTTDNWRGRRGQGPLAQFGPFERGQLRTAKIRDDVHPDRPQFPFRKVRDRMLRDTTQWPAPTEGISRLSIKINAVQQARMRKVLATKIGWAISALAG